MHPDDPGYSEPGHTDGGTGCIQLNIYREQQRCLDASFSNSSFAVSVPAQPHPWWPLTSSPWSWQPHLDRLHRAGKSLVQDHWSLNSLLPVDSCSVFLVYLLPSWTVLFIFIRGLPCPAPQIFLVICIFYSPPSPVLGKLPVFSSTTWLLLWFVARYSYRWDFPKVVGSWGCYT